MSAPALTPLAVAVLRVDGEPERILQIECEEGDGVLFLAREFPAARVRGVDRSRRAVAAALGRVGLDPEGRVAFKQGAPGSLPYPRDFFDLVAQAKGRVRARELARVLRPGGHLVLIDRARWPGWRLGRHGIAHLESGDAGDRTFHVGRLAGGT